MQRTDIHRPSAIRPDDYEFVGCEVIKVQDVGDVFALQAERERIRAHMASTGGTYSRHAHGGNCHVCGNANAIYTVLFWHEPTNVYIRVGQDCADKMDCGDASMFRRLDKVRDGVAAARQARAGKMKAESILTDAGIGGAWAIFARARQDSDRSEEATIRDIVAKLVVHGSLSDKQVNFLRVLLDRVERRDEIDAQRAAETAAAAPVPNGRMTVAGKVLSLREPSDFDAFRQWKMLLQHADGWKAWGSLPAAICDVQVGQMVEFCATVQQSNKDPKFGFFSRPTKARVVS